MWSLPNHAVPYPFSFRIVPIGAVGLQDDRVVARIACPDFVHDAEAGDVVIAARDQRRPRRRAQRGRVEVRVAQPGVRDAIQSRTWDDAAESARHAEAVVVRHDEQDVWRALRRHDARRPPGRRLRGPLLDDAAKGRIGRRKLFAVDGGGGASGDPRTPFTCCAPQRRRTPGERERRPRLRG